MIRKFILFLFIIVIQVGIIFPPVSPAKAAQCCKTYCNHKVEKMPNSCPMHQKNDYKETNPVDCCKNHCVFIGQIDAVTVKQDASINDYHCKIFPISLASNHYIPLTVSSSDLKKDHLSFTYREVTPPLFIQNCSLLN
ncbi:MAG: hypothetical protein HY279_11840 [Nitrospinae bacterium]|nr:hypothetical protein [Nitrospinota bacterium]